MKVSWLKYILYLLAFGLFIGLGDYLLRIIKNAIEYSENLSLHTLIITSSMIFFFGGFGVLLGLKNLLQERKKEGVWKVNYIRLIILGLPALYISLSYIIFYANNTVANFLANTIILYGMFRKKNLSTVGCGEFRISSTSRKVRLSF